MHHDFIQIKSLNGELKISHKMSNIGLTVTTEELVIQKPHLNYHIPLDRIVSIIPYESRLRGYSYVNRRDEREEVVRLGAGIPHYKLHVSNSTMHNRSGIFQTGQMEFVLPLHEDLLASISRYSELKLIL